MELKFKSIKAARDHLLEAGYRFASHGRISKCEIYAAGPLTAIVKRVPFDGVRVTIR